MKQSVLIAVSIGALALSGCNKTDSPTNDATTAASPSPDGVAPSAAASVDPNQAFADAAAASDAFEIETSKLAVQKAESSKVKRFAESMIKAHTESTAKLKAAAAAASPAITPLAELTAMQKQTLNDLSAKSGKEFETAYAKAQVDGHQMTLDKLKAYSADGAQPSLKAMATEMVPIVTAHLNMAKGL